MLSRFKNYVKTTLDKVKNYKNPIGGLETHFTIREALVLSGLVLANAYVIFNWQLEENIKRFPLTTWSIHAMIAAVTAAALDGAIVLTAIGRRQGRKGFWANITPYAIFLATALINYDVYSHGQWYPFVARAALHAIFTFGVLSFGNYLALPVTTYKQPKVVNTTPTPIKKKGGRPKKKV